MHKLEIARSMHREVGLLSFFGPIVQWLECCPVTTEALGSNPSRAAHDPQNKPFATMRYLVSLLAIFVIFPAAANGQQYNFKVHEVDRVTGEEIIKTARFRTNNFAMNGQTNNVGAKYALYYDKGQWGMMLKMVTKNDYRGQSPPPNEETQAIIDVAPERDDHEYYLDASPVYQKQVRGHTVTKYSIPMTEVEITEMQKARRVHIDLDGYIYEVGDYTMKPIIGRMKVTLRY